MPDDVLVEVGDPVVAHGDVGQERERPAVARAEDDVVDVRNGAPVHQVDCSVVVDPSNRRMSLYLGVVERLVAKISVDRMTFHDRVNRCLCRAHEIE